jgi:NAD(P)H dehydrogenase (quinone)
MDRLKMSLIITGASGNLGRRTAELLLDTAGVQPADVVLITRSPDKLADLAARGAEVRRGDFADPSTLSEAFAGATRVLIVSTDDMDTRVAQQGAAIDAARAAGAQLIAYTSIPNPDPANNPATVVASHAATEQAIRDSGVPFTFLRNALYSEYRIPEAQGALAQGVFAYNSGDGATAYVSREDCAAAAAAVLAGGDEHANTSYDITGPEALTGAALAALYASVGGSEVAAVAVDDAAFIAGAVEHGLPQPVAEMLASFGRAIREGQLDQLTGDVQAITGRPPVSLAHVLEAAGISRQAESATV